ncbi:VIT1/CCC1 transporter family protein [Wielerella bovis]|uniref:VIT1/CCC1 transporter family protein n=1 Tax=Wielerella bovis TaxID=2917790 RepID=UPI002018A2E9|nr:VIT family protein [Wielerella bovis]MCG7657883.1 VIT family protein [Wielerella bovis]MCG7660105.1 VIT family protein [Wielerella bovis]
MQTWQRAHSEPHYSSRNKWLRAAVLGANDGLISTASLLMGMAAANASTQTLWLTGMAALVAGAVSMAAGEYVSVSSQADTERADLAKESKELSEHPQRELTELTDIYRSRGLDDDLAHQVALALTRHNALQAHARDEIGLTDELAANPFQAAYASAIAFCAGALPPVLVAVWADNAKMGLAITALLGLALLGAVSAKLGGAPVLPAMRRVMIWGVIALASTAIIGGLFGVQAA